MTPATIDSGEPRCCPWCGGKLLRNLDTWRATSDQEEDHTAKLTQYQCANEAAECETLTFFA